MNDPITLQDVANIITFIAPGYFAIQTYSLVYAKRHRDFSHLVIESVVCSLPLVALTNLVWKELLHEKPVSATDTKYALVLFGISLGIGLVFTLLRAIWPVKHICERFGLGSPNEDFVKAQFSRLKKETHIVTVKLRNGDIFSGSPSQSSRYYHDGLKFYYFTELAWLNKSKKWDEKPGGLIVSSGEIEYIETPTLRGD